MAHRKHKRSGFADLPGVHRRRSNFNLSHRVLTTMPIGKLCPIDICEVLPGDTWTQSYASLTRVTSSFIHPIMDNVFLDTYSFFVPLRLCLNNLEDVFGDSRPNAYSSLMLATIPSFDPVDAISIRPGTVGDYLGLPVNSEALPGASDGSYYIDRPVSVLPFRAFALIWNEFFRNQTVDNEVNVNLGSEASGAESPNDADWSENNYVGKLPPVTRYKDYFSTCVLAPQKGPAMMIPGVQGAPVITSNVSPLSGTRPSLDFKLASGSLPSGSVGFNSSGSFGVVSGSSGVSVSSGVYPSNLVVDGQDSATISSLRTAFQLQKYLERDSIFGSRYREYLYAAYGVTSPDSRMQVPEFLSGAHNRIAIQQQVITANGQNSEAGSLNDYRPGNVAGYTQSMSSKDGRFSKSFTEHGYVITVGCIRFKHLYSQSLNRMWNRVSRTDFYDPLFANLSQQAVYSSEIVGYSDGSGQDSPVFGYQEAWADYRVIPDRVSASARPGLSNGIGDYWSVADVYQSTPSLVDLIHEDGTAFQRVLTVTNIDPFIVDFAFRCSVSRVVTPFSTPGYVDHH